ncbi:hypothetical protein KGQ20_30890 [Catenulispora sp. NF23]|uniref:Uncharacterized protein n=1 Tax=Catenulispora pinistramenti TaxID=2705254 RepID=A0ABS5L3D4_9ACTN|nr:hypothetical protein [Catenulispora pinistramenti]MBS2537172.1 hypothetical protein [Catenulispora pinistramenti]MBS2552853.1 hypothetical protein [Catenulispora pinistramenti]
MKRTRVVIIGGSAAVVVLAAGSAVAATQLGGHNAQTALPKASCGSAITRAVTADTSVTSADPGALTCFQAAARTCSPAAVQVSQRGIDAGRTYVFQIKSGGATCQVDELSQGYLEPDKPGQVQSVTCDRAGVTTEGVTLTCGGQTVLIPSTTGPVHPL